MKLYYHIPIIKKDLHPPLAAAYSGSSPFSAPTKRTAHLLHLLFAASYFFWTCSVQHIFFIIHSIFCSIVLCAGLSRLFVCLAPPLAAAYSGSSPFSAPTKRTAHLLHLLFAASYFFWTCSVQHIFFIIHSIFCSIVLCAGLSRLFVCLAPPLAAAYSGSSPFSAPTKRTAHLLHLLFAASYFFWTCSVQHIFFIIHSIFCSIVLCAGLSRLFVCLAPPLAAAYSGSSPFSAPTKRTAHLKVSCSFGADEGT